METLIEIMYTVYARVSDIRLITSVPHAPTPTQAQGLASALGTAVGTSIRIPCEVMKQRLQVGRHSNVIEAFQGALRSPEGVRGLFRGTTATLSREVPFYTLGMTFYVQLKKLAVGMCQYVHT